MELRALVLAAGRGVRMRPLTEECAKPALPVLGTSLVGRIVRQLGERGVSASAVNAFHGAESLAAALERDVGGRARLFRESVLMGTGGALDAPRDLLAESDPFLVHNGDTLTDTPIEALVAAARQPACLGALLVRRPAAPGYTRLAVEDGRLVGLGEDAGESATYLGVAALRRSVLDRVPAGRPSELFDDVLLPLLAEGCGFLAVVAHQGRWLEFTSPSTYRRMLVDLVRDAGAGTGLMLPGGRVDVAAVESGWLFRADDADAEEVAVNGAAVVESGARIGRDCRLEDAVVLEGARIDAGAVLERSIAAPGVEIPAGTHLADELALPGPVGRDLRRVSLADVGESR
jgi:mannose-1-phosphate guanylyltransferase